VTIAELEAQLRERQQQYGAAAEVRIRCDRRVEYRHVSPVMLACTRAGFWNVTFAVARRGEAS
jgi:biopolymer transport protein ExbD